MAARELCAALQYALVKGLWDMESVNLVGLGHHRRRRLWWGDVAFRHDFCVVWLCV